MTLNTGKNRHWQTFLLALAVGAVMFLPFVIWDKGYFFFTGDFNVQQIPFYKLAHQAVRSGDLFWNWNTDLGANFIGSYSFYLLMSPFFWITLLFPNSWVPFLIAPLLVLKMACAAFTSYFYIKRFVKDSRYAVIGALLYAFSGFSIYNIFFNHFHEAIVFFPLLLISLEELIQHDRRGFFAIAVAVNALVNYWFFIGEAVFVILYFFIRATDRDGFPISLKKFICVALEALLGIGLAAFIFLPSVLAILGNPRTTQDHIINGWNFWVYWQERRPTEILYSLFFPPDLTYDSFLFTDQAAKWSSLNAWLPLLSLSGVIAYAQCRKNDWVKKLLYTCLFIALVPGLNSMFILFNSSYYARWFYMPILVMSMASVIALEDQEIHYERGIRWTLIITAGVLLAAGLTPKYTDGKWSLGLVSRYDRYAVVAVIALTSIALIWILIRRYRSDERQFQRMLTVTLSGMIILSGAAFLTIGKVMHSPKPAWIVEHALDAKDEMQMHDDTFVRSDIYQGMDNLGMYWQIPNIQAFHSIVPVSIMEFYPSVGVKRDVSSKPDPEFYALRAFLSVKWLYIEETKEEQEPMPGFTFFDNRNTFNIYQNDNYIPMGFAYDYCCTRSFFDGYSDSDRTKLLLKAIVLEDGDIIRNSDILPDAAPLKSKLEFTQEAFENDAADRRRQSAYFFETDNLGFTSKIVLPEENLVFFSVPYDEGWSAEVNGEPAEILRANIGFMAVRCPGGESEIRFRYMPPGLLPGLAVTAAGIAILVVYMMWASKRKKEAVPPPEYPAPPYAGSEDEDLGPEQFLDEVIIGFDEALLDQPGFAEPEEETPPEPPADPEPPDEEGEERTKEE